VAHALALLRAAAVDHAGAIVQATSLGAEDMVVTDLIARHRLPIADRHARDRQAARRDARR
jgi:phosphoadenosine phosphosulfate reductase